MYKNDKQNMMILLIIVAVGLLAAIAFDMKNAVVLTSILLVFGMLRQFQYIEWRIRQLEHDHQIPVGTHTSLPKWAVYLGGLVGLAGYLLQIPAAIFAGIGLGVFSLIQILNVFNQRLQFIEHKKLEAPHNSLVEYDLENDRPLNQQPITLQAVTREGQQDTASQPGHVEAPPVINTQAHPEKWWQPVFDWLAHGNPILRVAVAILMIGVVLLLRFASEHWQLSLSIKLLFITITGGGVTVLGYYLRRNNALFAIALQGVGLAVVFLTLIFAHHYAVIASLTMASLFFAVLLVITVALSLLQNAVYLSMLALSMAYLAPLVIPQYQPDSIFLLGYYLVINIAVAAMNYIKSWKVLNHIAFFATLLIAGGVIVMYAEPAQYRTLDTILWLHIILFIWLSIRYSQLVHQENQSLKGQDGIALQPLVDVGLIFSVPILGFSLHAILMHQSSSALTWGAVALGLIYAGLGWWIKQKQSELSILAKSFFILSATFIALVFPLAQGAHWAAIGWAVQGTALIVWGVSEHYRLSRYLGIILVLCSSVALFNQVWSNEHFPTLSTAIYAIAQFISAYYLLRFGQKETSDLDMNFPGNIFLGLALYAGAIAGVQLFSWQGHGLSPYLAFASLFLLGFALIVHYRAQLQWLLPQLVMSSILVLLSYSELAETGLWIGRHWPDILQQLTFLFSVLGLCLLLVGTEKTQQFAGHYTAWWSGLLWLSLAAFGAGFWSASALVALGILPALYGIWRFRTGNLRWLDQPAVWILTLLWLVMASLSERVFAGYYLPVLNPVDLLSVVLLTGLLWIIYHHDFYQQGKVLEWGYKVIAILAGLFVLSSIVVRALHVYMATPLWNMRIWSNGLVQLSLTLLWVILAFVLMTFSSQRHIRQLWFLGAALLAIVVIKLVGLDLSQSGTLTRVISFIGAGGVMLVIAYLAPLPPVETAKQD